MRKIFFIFPAYFLLLNSLFSFLIPQKALAASCQVTPVVINLDDGFRIPTEVKAGQRLINLDIQTPGLVADERYWIKIGNEFVGNVNGDPWNLPLSENKIISINNVNAQGIIDVATTNPQTFQKGKYLVSIYGPKDISMLQCTGEFPVAPSAATSDGDKCKIELTTNSTFDATSNNEVFLTLRDLDNKEKELDIVVKAGGEGGTDRKTWNSIPISELTGNVKNLGLFETGSYYLAVGRGLGNFLGLGKETFCSTKFSICPSCKINVFNPDIGPFFAPPPLPCGNRTAEGTCSAVNTGVGLIPTSPAGLVSFLFELILGLSGGIALILIIVGAYQMMTSQGNPERLQGAKETITSAIVGLLFIIFSFLLLEIIGIDILKIPGLNR